MEWLNIHRSTLASDAFLGCDPVQRATWLCLLAYCADQENGGKIEGAETWVDRKWQQVVRITKEEANAPCLLWSWKDGTLIVWAYPIEKEQEVKRNRINGGKGGRPPKPENNHLVPSGLRSGLTQTVTQTEPSAPISAETEGNRKGIGKEGLTALVAEDGDQPAKIPKGAQTFIDLWNDHAKKSGLATIKEWTTKRATRLKALAATYSKGMGEAMPLAVQECHKAAWAIQNRANVDHILVPDNFQRYLDKARTGAATPQNAAAASSQPAAAPKTQRNAPAWVADKIKEIEAKIATRKREKQKYEWDKREQSAKEMEQEIFELEIQLNALK